MDGQTAEVRKDDSEGIASVAICIVPKVAELFPGGILGRKSDPASLRAPPSLCKPRASYMPLFPLINT